MEGLKAKAAAFQDSKPGLFLQKFMDDRATNLAALLAWNTLSAILPLILGVLALSGLVLRDPKMQDQVYNTLYSLLPAQMTSGFLGSILDSMRKSAAAPASVVALVLLLWNGSGFFRNMAGVFDQAYHVPDRNIVLQVIVAVGMLIISTALLIISILALGLGGLVGSLPFALPAGPILTRVVSWSISILTAVLMFVLIYKILPNKPQSWRGTLPGALSATVLMFVTTLIFPIYLSLVKPNQAYAVFGIFLVFTFYLYIISMVFVFGAELNAFLEEPARSVALAEAQNKAQQGKATVQTSGGSVKADAMGDAPSGVQKPAEQSGGILGQRVKSGQQPAQPQTAAQPQHASATASMAANLPEPTNTNAAARPSVAGKLFGSVALLGAAMLLRKRSSVQNQRA